MMTYFTRFKLIFDIWSFIIEYEVVSIYPNVIKEANKGRDGFTSLELIFTFAKNVIDKDPLGGLLVQIFYSNIEF